MSEVIPAMKIAPAQKQATEEEEKGAKDLAVATQEAEEETKASKNKNSSKFSSMRHFSPVAACLVLMV